MTTGRLHRALHRNCPRRCGPSPLHHDVRKCIPRLTEHKLGHADRTVRSVVIHRACRFPFPSQTLAEFRFRSWRPDRRGQHHLQDVRTPSHIEFSTQLGHAIPCITHKRKESHPKCGFPSSFCVA